jgi:glycosyltransferase involved in cell wall biosynthesis
MNRKKYFINSFYYLYELFVKHLNDRFDFTYTPPFHKPLETPLPARIFVLRNFIFLKTFYLLGKMKKFDIVQLNRAEGFLNFKKYTNQVSIFEIHGFDVGVRGGDYLKDLHTPWKVWLGTIIDRLIEKKVIKKIQEPDILYVSTPDLVEPIEQWSGRRPTWLPNPIDTSLFTADGPVKKLEGNPAILLAARLHGDKKPEVAFEIFEKHILPKHPNAVLHLLTTGELVPHYKLKIENCKFPQNFAWLPYMDKPTLASVIRGADLVFGDFSIGALSMLPMQVMLCKKPIITLDKYELIKEPVENLPALTLKLLEDDSFKQNYVQRNYEYVKNTHSPEAICQKHLANIEAALRIKTD